MHADVWRSLLGRIPAQKHDILMVMTVAGTEINLQSIIRMEEHFLVLRGRLAGTNDTGKIFFLPFEQIDHFGFRKPLNDTQINALFSDSPVDAAFLEPISEDEERAAAMTREQPEDQAQESETPPSGEASTTSADPDPSASPNLLTRLPSKNEILERLRQRAVARSGGSAQKE